MSTMIGYHLPAEAGFNRDRANRMRFAGYLVINREVYVMQKKGIGFLVIVMIAGLAGSLLLVLESARAQSRTGKSTIVLNVTSGREDVHAVTMALQLANHALDDGRAAVLFLNVRAPDLARRDLPDSLVLRGNPPIRRMVAELITRGAAVLVCPSCAKVMGVNRDNLIEGAAFATRESLFGALGPNAVVFTY
jgi:predicted peroxiredoxin